uniref:Keratin type II head domain-containing protein n=1 Tax=Serinus canaria TaxID=9135 RepID=A0A8C9N270_SERCA
MSRQSCALGKGFSSSSVCFGSKNKVTFGSMPRGGCRGPAGGFSSRSLYSLGGSKSTSLGGFGGAGGVCRGFGAFLPGMSHPPINMRGRNLVWFAPRPKSFMLQQVSSSDEI